MKGIIYCFSGTGNTKLVCDVLSSSLAKRGCDITVYSFDYNSYKCSLYPSPNDFDIVGIAYPIYGFNAPFLVNRFVKSLPDAKNGQLAFVIKTSGEPFGPNNYSSNVIKKRLIKKGYKFIYDQHYLMPYNIMFRYPDELAKQMYLYVNAHTDVVAKRILNNEEHILHCNPLWWFLYIIAKLVWIGGPIIGKTYHIKKSRCTKCKLCVKNCPMSNIRLKDNGYPKFGFHCMSCMRCVMFCPHNAINAGILNRWKVNGNYKFEKYMSDDSISANYINRHTKGYFKSFNKYFDTLDNDLKQEGIQTPRSLFPEN